MQRMSNGPVNCDALVLPELPPDIAGYYDDVDIMQCRRQDDLGK